MKWVAITILLLVIGAFWNVFSSSENGGVRQSDAKQKAERVDRSVQSVNTISSSIFIPYWNIPSSSENLSKYDTLIYFGVAPDSSGTMIADAGLKNIESFIANTSSRQQRLLTIRMLDDDVSLALLEDVSRQTSVIRQTVDIANEYGFDGIVLDLELGVIPFEDSKDKITSFVKIFSEAVQDEDLTFSMTIYGDVFYRARPYNMAALAKHLDHLYIMAYDFHKRRGEPGPNFPFDQFKEMVTDFTTIMSPQDITVVFGMYGYDWTLGKQGLPLKAAVAVPLDGIDGIDAIVDPNSLEKHILYIDDEGFNHELWYEDEESADVKIEYLKEQGVGSVGYWVWGYFN